VGTAKAAVIIHATIVQVAPVNGIVALPSPVVMTPVAIVETAVTARHVAPIQTMCVVRIQVIIAASMVKLVARGIVALLVNVVMMARA
jgi:hypothetical protein